MDNINNSKKNTVEKNPAVIKPAVKTVYLDAGGNISRGSSFLGILFLFMCIFAVCMGLILCVSQSFNLEFEMTKIILTLTVSLLFFTLIYFLPSRIFTFTAFLIGSGGVALYIIYNFNYIKEAAYYTLNLCLYRINQEGYIIGSIVDYDLAKTENITTAGYINLMAVLAVILFAAFFSFFVYSKRNIAYSLLFSVAVVFPGFFYGLIPGYFSFSLVAAFWVSQFSINMFESGYMAYFIGKENSIPEKKLEKYKLRMFKKQYKRNIKSIKSEIVNIVKSPNRNENTIRLDKLIRQLESISKNQRLFMMFYGLNDLRRPKRSNPQNQRKQNKKADKNKNIDKLDKVDKFGEIIDSTGKKSQDKIKKEKFVNPVQTEKRRLKVESKEKKTAERLRLQNAKKDFANKPFSEKIKIKFGDNFRAKKKFSVKGGYAGFFAFVVALAAITAVQPFISPKAKFNVAMPEKIMNFLTSTIEYTLVGSDSSVYGGYNGGMGGGFLYRPEGAKFRDKPILKVTSGMGGNYMNLKSGVIYLKGWSGTIYTGNMWQEADKKQIEEYKDLSQNSPLPRFSYISEKMFFQIFTQSMQNKFGASYPRQSSELKQDRITIEHLVSGGKRSFLPYFFESYDGGLFNFKTNSDLNIEITNSLFKYPIYTSVFYSVDNILNRAVPTAVEDLREYLNYYYSKLDTETDMQNFFSQLNPGELTSSMPDVRFFSESEFFSMSNRSFDRLNEEGMFYQYSAPSPEYNIEEYPEYHGYIYIPHKYDEIIDVIKVRYNIYSESGNANSNFINSDFVNSEVIYNKFVRKHYLGVPDNFPQEVIDLAKEITAGLSTDYDKALAIEKYLAQNYTYTLNPQTPYDPKADFVYNFLLDTKEGYCTAYASSMVMMLRVLDIPARYSEGYLVDTSKRQRDEHGKEHIIVYDYDGHAWPEVYLRGIGWIPFEPTVSYVEAEEAVAEPYVYNPPARLPSEGYYSMPLEEPEEEDEIDDEGQTASGLSKIFIAVLIIIFICVVIYAVNLLIISKRFKKFKSANTNAAVIKMLAYIIIFLKHCGFVMHNEEGLKAFSKRVSPNFETINPDGWAEIAEIMQKARYSKHKISEDERESVYEFVETLRTECLKKLKFNLRFKLRFVYFIL